MIVIPPPDEPDWSREVPRGLWDPSRRLLQTIRKHQLWTKRRGASARVMRKLWAMQHRFWSVVTAAEIPLTTEIGGGLLIPHPNGIVIHPNAKIGPNCLIFQQVTLGTRGGDEAPTLAGRVDVGAGARVLGEVSIGEYSKVGANSVVISSHPRRSVLVGAPAKCVRRTRALSPKRLPVPAALRHN